MDIKSNKFIYLGILMMFVGWLCAFLMLISIVRTTFFLSFFSYGVATTGLFIGYLGVFSARQDNKKN